MITLTLTLTLTLLSPDNTTLRIRSLTRGQIRDAKLHGIQVSYVPDMLDDKAATGSHLWHYELAYRGGWIAHRNSDGSISATTNTTRQFQYCLVLE